MKKNRLRNVWDATAAEETAKPAKPELRNTVKPPSGETVTVGAKVYKELAHHWTAQSKLKRRAVSDVIRDALVAEFGLPEGFDAENVKPELRKDVKPD